MQEDLALILFGTTSSVSSASIALSANSVAENASNNDTVGTFTAPGTTGIAQWTITDVSNTFSVDINTGVVTVTTATNLVSNPSFPITVHVTGLTPTPLDYSGTIYVVANAPVISYSGADPTNDTTPAISLTGTIYTGDIITLLNGASVYGTHTVVGGDVSGGSFSFSGAGLPDGAISLTAKIGRGGYTSAASNAVTFTVDTVAPVLSSATAVKNGSSHADLSVATDTTGASSGLMYWFISTSSSPPNATDLKAGTGATSAGSAAVASSPKAFSAVGTLASNTTYYAYFAQTDAAGNTSSVASAAASFTTDTATITGDVELLGTQISSGNSGYPNLLQSPQKFTSSAAWSVINATIADGVATSPDGTSTATSLTETTANNEHRLQQIYKKAGSAISYAIGVYAKVGPVRSRIAITAANGANSSGSYAVFDLAGAQVGVAAGTYGSGFSASAASISSVGSGWCLCKFNLTSDTDTTLNFFVEPDKNTGTQAINNFYVGSTAGVAVYLFGAFLTPATQTSNLLANLIDDNSATWWEDYQPLAWAGVDVGSGNTAVPTGIYFTPRLGNSTKTTPTTAAYLDPWLDYPIQLSGSQFNQIPATIETSSDPTFASAGTTIDTLPTTASTPIYPAQDVSYRALSGSAARAFRMRMPYGNLSQLFFTANAGPTNARPIRPTISPASGLYPAGSTTITITSGTTSAAIYYTTDGTTPDNTKTLYTAPFTLTVGSSTTLKAVAYDASATLTSVYSSIVTSNYTSNKITPLQDWYDINRGILVEAHGGSLIEVGSYIYWCGESANEQDYAAVPRQDYGVYLYRCTNNESDPGYLKAWTFIGQILPQPATSGTYWAGCERPHIVWNANTSKFVLCAHVSNSAFTIHKCALATTSGSDIESGWSWSNTNFDPSGNGFKDCNFYTNAANTSGYLVYTGASGANNLGMYITLLDSNFTSASSTNTVVGSGTREAPVLFDNGTNLFLITGKAYAYTATGDGDVQYAEISGLDPMQTWGSLTGSGRVFNTNPAGSGAADPNYQRSQPSFVFKPVGKTNQYILGCDLWASDTTTLYSSRQAWSPITITATTIVATQPASWDIGDLT